MVLAHYTRSIMQDLERDGRTAVDWTVLLYDRWGENPNWQRAQNTARSRITNAARRAGLVVHTYIDGNYMRGKVVS